MSSVRSAVIVEAPPDRAFRVFTEKMDTWWPASHHVAKTAFKDIILEARANGRWAEVSADGSTCEWGKVLVYDPPRRLVLGWQLNAEFQYDASFITEVEVSFTPMGATKTRVELEHRNLERYGVKEDSVRKSVGSDGGWLLILKKFGEAASQQAAVA